jgi:hypothetical protein
MSQEQQEDYLDEDKAFKKPVKNQRFCVLSMLTPNCFPENKRETFKEQKILGVKFRGVFETYEDAKSRANFLQTHDKYHNIFVGEVGKWLPFDVDISSLDTQDDPVYREKSLNTYMKAYKECLEDETQEQKDRKDTKLADANVVTGKTGVLKTGSAVEEQEEESEETEETGNKEFINQKTVEDRMTSTVNERNELQNQVAQNNEELDGLKGKLDELKNMFSDLNN